MPFELLVDVVRVADALSLTPAKVRRLADRGQLPCRLLPDGSRRFDPAELQEWVSQLRHVSETATV
jgi:hypothetical protein